MTGPQAARRLVYCLTLGKICLHSLDRLPSLPLSSATGHRSGQRRSDGSGRLRYSEATMAEQGSPRRFARIDRLPPYVFNITAELKMAARRRGEDIIDLSMGNPDGATPPHIVEKLVTVAQREDTHGYSTSRGIPRLRRAISSWYKERYEVDIDPESEA